MAHHLNRKCDFNKGGGSIAVVVRVSLVHNLANIGLEYGS